MDRYDNIPIIRTVPTVQYPTSIRYRSSVRYPDIPLSENDVFLYTIRGDRLDNLAYQFYGDPTLYWIFQIANELNRDSLYPPIGVQLRIPQDLTKILQDFDKINS